MGRYADDWSRCPEKFEGLSWDRFLQVRSIDYKGDEVRLARTFRWENLEPALPQGIASIPLCEVCDLGTLDFITRFEGYLLPEDARVYTKPPRVMADESSWGDLHWADLQGSLCAPTS